MITIAADGTVFFKVYLPHAAKVEVMGDFTDWGRSRVPMTRSYPGWWTVQIKIDPGQHRFCYVIDGSIHLADYAAHGVQMDDGGRWVSSLHLTVEEHTALRPARQSVPA